MISSGSANASGPSSDQADQPAGRGPAGACRAGGSRRAASGGHSARQREARPAAADQQRGAGRRLRRCRPASSSSATPATRPPTSTSRAGRGGRPTANADQKAASSSAAASTPSAAAASPASTVSSSAAERTQPDPGQQRRQPGGDRQQRHRPAGGQASGRCRTAGDPGPGVAARRASGRRRRRPPGYARRRAPAQRDRGEQRRAGQHGEVRLVVHRRHEPHQRQHRRARAPRPARPARWPGPPATGAAAPAAARASPTSTTVTRPSTGQSQPTPVQPEAQQHLVDQPAAGLARATVTATVQHTGQRRRRRPATALVRTAGGGWWNGGGPAGDGGSTGMTRHEYGAGGDVGRWRTAVTVDVCARPQRLPVRRPASSRRAPRRDLRRLRAERFDVLVIGGGVTGAGAALDAASRGLTVALVEARDLAAGTSSRSSKLIHGGLRYLEQLEFHLVHEALTERGLLATRLAPHLVRPVPILVPLPAGRGLRACPPGLPPLLLRGRGGRVRRLRRALRRRPGDAAAPAPDPRGRPADLPEPAGRRAGRRDPLLRRPGRRRPAGGHPGPHRGQPRRRGGDQRPRGRADPAGPRGDRRPGPRPGGAGRLPDAEFEVHARTVIAATGVWSDDMSRMLNDVGPARPALRVRASKGVHLVVPRSAITGEAGLILRTATLGALRHPVGRALDHRHHRHRLAARPGPPGRLGPRHRLPARPGQHRCWTGR